MACSKVCHFSEESAVPHADGLEARLGVRPSIYKCRVEGCGCWHVGYSGEQRSEMKPKARRTRKHGKGRSNKDY
jgi:hypothetical protein